MGIYIIVIGSSNFIHLLSHFDSMQKFSALLLLRLSFQSLGVVYGDLGTSPLYVFYNTFPRGINDPEDVVGALSLIIYSLTLIPLLKYIFVVCRANDNGQGMMIKIRELIEYPSVLKKCLFLKWPLVWNNWCIEVYVQIINVAIK